ncbi:uncharacterized protein BDV17DRAFT_274122 [Aspergillus undulatus]|uniref:uncharacterized protein n=1 Tax=Aspergillus undulatus TaxID=1810928 RepID=UPI003CCE0AC5
MSFPTRPLLRIPRSRALLPRRIHSRPQRRTYASPPDPSKGGSNSTWIAIAAVLGIPAAYYLMSGSGAGTPPSSKDQPATRKAPAGEGSMSSKQEGLDNADSSNPYINEPGKSIKGEGETETAKFKGTVDPKRPQK